MALSRGLRIGLFVAAGFLVGALSALALFPQAWQKVFASASTGKALIGGPFTLTDQNGKRVTDKDFRGRFMLVYFGFTFCPDVCPSALQVMAAALHKLGPKAEKIVPIFITIDPERDTPEKMAQYVQSFDPRLVGLTGTPEEIAAVTREYRVYAKKVEDPKSTAGYTMDHSSIIYVIGPDGAYRTHFTHTTNVDAMAARLGEML
jgi:cytochrome oxidase Cu insertion factor (SCO1/SenC/PrrC family)